MILTPGRCKNTSNSRKLIFEGVKITFYAILSEIWDLDSLYCTNLEYKLVMIVQKTIWMIHMSIRLDFDTRKVQKYVKCKEIDVWGGQNHVLCYFIRNMGFRWPILHQSWVQISYDGLENNLDDSHVNKAWFWHQEGAKIWQMQGNWYLRRSKSRFMLIHKKY